MYNKLKYYCLDSIKYPYLFSCSANMSEEVKESCIASGFDGCLSSPLTLKDIQDLITNYVDMYVDGFMHEQLESLNLLP